MIQSAEEFFDSLGEVDIEVLTLIRSRDAAIEKEAYQRGYDIGYARRGYDDNWAKVEANL
jgi:hypothetical protein